MDREENLVRTIVARHLGLSPEKIQSKKPLAEQGMGSLKFMLSLLEIQRSLGREILDVNNVSCIKTLDDILALTRALPPARGAVQSLRNNTKANTCAGDPVEDVR